MTSHNTAARAHRGYTIGPDYARRDFFCQAEGGTIRGTTVQDVAGEIDRMFRPRQNGQVAGWLVLALLALAALALGWTALGGATLWRLLLVTLVVGAFLGIAAAFGIERLVRMVELRDRARRPTLALIRGGRHLATETAAQVALIGLCVLATAFVFLHDRWIERSATTRIARALVALLALLVSGCDDQIPVGVQRSYLLVGDSIFREGASSIQAVSGSPAIRS